MMLEAVFFYTFTSTMIFAALLVVFSRQPVYSVLSLLVVMFCLSALFIMLGAFFMAALQILLYAGAVLVLFLFVMMLLNLQPEALARMRVFTLRTVGTAGAAVWCALMWKLFVSTHPANPLSQIPPPAGLVEPIGRLLFTRYLLPFELVSFIILAAIIGAVTLGKQERSSK